MKQKAENGKNAGKLKPFKEVVKTFQDDILFWKVWADWIESQLGFYDWLKLLTKNILEKKVTKFGDFLLRK